MNQNENNLFFYRQYEQKPKKHSKSFKLTKESDERITFISRGLNSKQGNILELLIDNFLNDKGMYSVIISRFLEDELALFKIESELVDTFINLARKHNSSISNSQKTESDIYVHFKKILKHYLEMDSTPYANLLSQNPLLQQHLENMSNEIDDVSKFLFIFPYISKQMYEAYMSISKFVDFNETNLRYLNALALKIDSKTYNLKRFNTSQPMVQSMMELIAKDDTELLDLWQRFNAEVISKEKLTNFEEIYNFIANYPTEEYEALVKITDQTLENIQKLAPPFQEAFFL